MSEDPFGGMSRREFIAKVAAGGTGALMSFAGPVIEKAYGAGPCSGHLTDIEHIVLFLQENRSFDHYFGTLSGTDGFNTPSPAFQQKGWNPQTQQLDPAGTTIPFRFDTTRGPFVDGQCLNDPDHSWKAMHESWNGGANDNWLPAQVSASPVVGNVPVTMGYHTRKDIPIHHMLADTFTVCDRYYCSVLGPTLPNRLYWISASIDPGGTNGGPQLTSPAAEPVAQFSWTTMPENLSAAGISWKLYRSKALGPIASHYLNYTYDRIMTYFKQAQDPRSDLARFGIAPTYPLDFVADVKANRLPQVSWVVPNTPLSEHPAFPPAVGAIGIVQLLRILLSNPAVWEKTALIVAYDENGGFFDHVTPPTPPAGTPGEFLTVADINSVAGASGIRGPIGLGFRVPCIVISPYSRGPLMVHDVFDHTSQLKLIGKRFGVPIPNLTAWRDSTVGDMTSTFNFAVPPNPSRPDLGHPLLDAVPKLPQCVPNVYLGTIGLNPNPVTGEIAEAIPYRVPFPQTMPSQETTPARGVPSGLC
ncbi:Phospholipase C 1 [Mycobacterium simulans]|uniref:phospholipase C n=1 Tax=Mycobacterium simulans TaxID=627089 RepID=UPI0019B5A604|nr:phospholipase C [Mycobacterium simulans]SON62098.1 Phospholipase C 1 [Mycobacterium simulans]